MDQAVEVFTDTSGLSPGVEVRQAVQFDAGSFQTGIYPYRLTLSGNYTRSSISSVLSGRDASVAGTAVRAATLALALMTGCGFALELL